MTMDEINAETRRSITELAEEWGSAFLGIINRYSSHGDQPWVWEYTGGLVRNFDACFIIPARDPELERLLQERFDAPYTSTAADWDRLKPIFARIENNRGQLLNWA